MRKITFFIALCLSVISCADKADNPGKKHCTVRLNADDTHCNIFEQMEFRCQIDTEKGDNDLDSIIWTMGDDRLTVYNSEKSVFHWSHYFYVNGEYKAVLTGYYDNKIVTADTVSVEVLNDKDFLGYNWSDITGSTDVIDYLGVLERDYSFIMFASVDQGTPYVLLGIQRPGRQGEDVIAGNKEILYEYITDLYSKPAYGTDNNDLLEDAYNIMFAGKRDMEYPQNIWITSTSNVVLLKFYNKYLECDDYHIYAEPKN